MRRCRKCGCLDGAACWSDEEGACWWVEDDLCSACTPEAEGWEHPDRQVTGQLVAAEVRV